MVVAVSYSFPGKYFCIYCFKTLDNLKSPLTSPAVARTVHNIKSDHDNFRRDGLQLKNAKNEKYHNCIAPLIFNIPVEQVSKPVTNATMVPAKFYLPGHSLFVFT